MHPRIGAVVAGLAALQVACALWFSTQTHAFSVVVALVASGTCVLAGVRRHGRGSRFGRVLMASAGLNLGASLAWYGPLIVGGAAPLAQPSLADAGFVIADTLLAAAIFCLLARRERPLIVALDVLTIAVVVGLAAGVTLVAPDLGTSIVPLPVRSTQVCYVVADVLVLSAVIRVLLAPRGRPVALWLLSLAGIALVSSDFAWNWLTISGTYLPGSWADVGWALEPLFVAAAALHPSLRRVGGLEPRDTELGIAGPVLLGGASFATPMLLGAHGVCSFVPDADGSAATSLAIMVGGAVLAALVVTRFTLLLRRTRGLADRAVERLDESETRFRRLVEQIPGVLVVFSLDGLAEYVRPVYVSPQARAIMGIDPEAWMADAAAYAERIPDEDLEVLRGASARATLDGVAEAVEYRFTRSDGAEIWLRYTGGVITDGPDGRHMQGLLFDVTAEKEAAIERERMELELRLSQKLEAVGQLAAGIAHEINTPIQFVGDTVNFLTEAFDDLVELTGAQEDLRLAMEHGTATADLLERARQAAERADIEYLRERVRPALERSADGIARVAKIVGAMREFAHPPSDDMAPVDLCAAVRNTLVVSANAYKYVADVELELDDLPLVRCDGGDINQVLLNLVVNAAQAIEDAVADSGARGVIRLGARREGEDVVISIADTGRGIPHEIAQRIFDPFFTTKEVGRGTGQGLAISRTIVERHGGSLAFESSAGHGTTFHVRLPIGAAAAIEAIAA